MKLKKGLIEKILIEEKGWGSNEFGGWIVVKGNIIEDIIFDVENCTEGYVRLGSKKLLKQPAHIKKKIKGFFHKHPINGLSQLDMRTIMNLTDFWGECYSIVLQANDKLLLVKTIQSTDFVLRSKLIVETFRKEIELHRPMEDTDGFQKSD